MSLKDLLGQSAKFSANLATGRRHAKRHAKAWPIACARHRPSHPGGKHPGLLEARSRLYKGACGGETIREKRRCIAATPASLRTNLRKFQANAEKDQPCRQCDQLPAGRQGPVPGPELRA